MAREVNRGDVWMLELRPPDKRRPVVILSRPAMLEVLNSAIVASITSTIRGSPTEVTVGVAEGLKHPSVVNLVNVFTVRQSDLRRYVGSVGPAKMREVCRALVLSCGCD